MSVSVWGATHIWRVGRAVCLLACLHDPTLQYSVSDLTGEASGLHERMAAKFESSLRTRGILDINHIFFVRDYCDDISFASNVAHRPILRPLSG
jgi:hypothetical protein